MALLPMITCPGVWRMNREVCYSAREGWDGPVVIYFRNLFLGSLATTTVKLNNLR